MLLAALALGSAAFAEDAEEAEGSSRARHCAGEGGPRLVLHQLVAAQYNPWGVEHSVRFGACVPLVTTPGVLFDYTHVELGVVNYLSPVYTQFGGYAQITPLSFLQLRAEVSWLGYWPFFFNRAGYFSRQNYDADYRDHTLPSDQAGRAFGWNVNLIATFRARVSVGPVAIAMLSMFSVEAWALGDEPYYLNLRRDLILRQTDWLLANEAIACVEIPLTEVVSLRIGAYDSYRGALMSGEESNQVGLIIMPVFSRLGSAARDFSPFVRVGAFTHHPFRRGTVGVLAGLMASYSLLPL